MKTLTKVGIMLVSWFCAEFFGFLFLFAVLYCLTNPPHPSFIETMHQPLPLSLFIITILLGLTATGMFLHLIRRPNIEK